MAEEQTRENKRVRQACDNCRLDSHCHHRLQGMRLTRRIRRKKTRCSGERPVCAFCARLGQHCHYAEEVYPDFNSHPSTDLMPQENNRLAARVALLESRLSLLDANGSIPTAYYASVSSPEQRSVATDREREHGARVERLVA